MNRFQGRVAVVTGAASGIGAATALRLGQEGASVVLADLDQVKAAAMADEVGKTAEHSLGLMADVADEMSVSRLVDRTVAEFGRLDVMVNNAGVGEASTPIEEKTAADWNRVISINLTGTFFGLKHAARVMKRSGRPGVIVNVSSVLGLVGFKGAPAYTAAKHGMLGLTKEAALELAPAGIRVVAVSPAFIRTPLIQGLEDAVLPLHPAGRLGTPEEVAALIAFVASEEAGFLTGATYLIDGGYTAQ